MKRALLISLSLVLLVFSPGLPWSAPCRNAVKAIFARDERMSANKRSENLKLISISGRVNATGAQVQALGSRSRWAVLADEQGRFILPDVVWFPGATYILVVSADGNKGKLVRIAAPVEFPDDKKFDIGEIDLNRAREVNFADLPITDSIHYEDYDDANSQYYKDLFDKLTAGKASDEEKIDSINNYVATKLNFEERQWELGTPRRVLERGSRYCGHLSIAMATLLEAGNYRTRMIDMTDGATNPYTHVVIEVFYNGRWHLYGPTYGVKFLDKSGNVMSYKDLRFDTSPISEDLFSRLDHKMRSEVLAWMPRVYRSGYHHFSYIKKSN